jgi:hypothetical protein
MNRIEEQSMENDASVTILKIFQPPELSARFSGLRAMRPALISAPPKESHDRHIR